MFVSCDHLTCGYHDAPVLRDVTFRVNRGEFVGIIGPSGGGKSTLLNSLLGLVPDVRGTISVDGRSIRPGSIGRNVGYVPQLDVRERHFPLTVEQDVALALTPGAVRLPWVSKSERIAVHRVLGRLGIEQMSQRAVGELSGGQQQRLAVARAIINEPELLLLDEPTSNLDVKTRDDVLGVLFELNANGTAIMMTTHAINNLAVHLPRLICINGRLLADGTPTEIFEESILSRTFETDIRIIREEETGLHQMIESGSWVPTAMVDREPVAPHAR